MSTRQTVEPITPRQREVLELLAANRTNFEIAQALGISLDGAKWHVREVLARLGVDSREQAAEYWRRERSWVRRAIAFLTPVAQMATSKVGVFAAVALVSGAVVAGAFALRGGRDETPSQGEASASPTATAVADDLAPRTDVPMVDQVIAIAQAGDLAGFRRLMVEFPEACTTGQRGVGSPPACPPGVADGAPVDTFRALAEERADPGPDLDQLLGNVVPNATTLYAVIRSQADRYNDFIPPSDYEVLVMGRLDGQFVGGVYFVDDRGVVGLVAGYEQALRRLTNLDSSDWVIAPPHIPRFEPDKTPYVLGRDTEIRFTAQMPPACAGEPMAIRLYGYPDPGVAGGIQSMTEPGLSGEARSVGHASGTTAIVFPLPATASGPMVVRAGLLAPCLSGIAVQGELDLALVAAPEDAEVAVIEYFGKVLDTPVGAGETPGERLESLTAKVGDVSCVTLPTSTSSPRNTRGNVEFRIGGADQPPACSVPGEPVVFYVASGVLEGVRMFEKPLMLPGVVQLIRNIGPDGISN
jgi:DNA-binding CsgD family transcriptional regulator